MVPVHIFFFASPPSSHNRLGFVLLLCPFTWSLTHTPLSVITIVQIIHGVFVVSRAKTKKKYNNVLHSRLLEQKSTVWHAVDTEKIACVLQHHIWILAADFPFYIKTPALHIISTDMNRFLGSHYTKERCAYLSLLVSIYWWMLVFFYLSCKCIMMYSI